MIARAAAGARARGPGRRPDYQYAPRHAGALGLDWESLHAADGPPLHAGFSHADSLTGLLGPSASGPRWIVAAPVLSGTDILTDPLYLERGDIIEIDDDELGPVRMHGVVPRLRERPGLVRRPGQALGADTDTVLGEWLGHSAGGLTNWRRAGVI
jgi:hypothetical protein